MYPYGKLGSTLSGPTLHLSSWLQFGYIRLHRASGFIGPGTLVVLHKVTRAF